MQGINQIDKFNIISSKFMDELSKDNAACPSAVLQLAHITPKNIALRN